MVLLHSLDIGILSGHTLLFVVGAETRAVSSMIEASEYIAAGRNVVLVLQEIEDRAEIGGAAISGSELSDLNRGDSTWRTWHPATARLHLPQRGCYRAHYQEEIEPLDQGKERGDTGRQNGQQFVRCIHSGGNASAASSSMPRKNDSAWPEVIGTLTRNGAVATTL